jgi:hypothetical protein
MIQKSRSKSVQTTKISIVVVALVYSNSHDNELVKKWFAVLESDVGPVANSEALRAEPNADILEHYYSISVIARVLNCQLVINSLSRVLPSTTVYGAFLSLLINPAGETSANALNVSVPSMNLLPYRFFGDEDLITHSANSFASARAQASANVPNPTSDS